MIPVLLLAFLLTPAYAVEELTVAAQVDKGEVKQGEVLTYSVTIAGSIQETPKVHLTAFEGFQVVSTGQSQQIQVAAGKAKLTLTLRYSLAPTAIGTHTLGPVKVEYRGQTYETQPIEVRVAPGAPRKEPPQLEGGVIL
jgi:uncharacterized protein (DUF58 family)